MLNLHRITTKTTKEAIKENKVQNKQRKTQTEEKARRSIKKSKKSDVTKPPIDSATSKLSRNEAVVKSPSIILTRKSDKALNKTTIAKTTSYKTSVIDSLSNFFENNKSNVIILLVVFFGVFFTYGPNLNSNIPSWEQIYAKTGLELEEGVGVYNEPLTVSFLNVGQGDSAFICTENFKALIDFGEQGSEQIILSTLSKYRVKSLDAAIVTHPHSDHFGSMSKVLSTVPCDKLLLSKFISANEPISPISTETSKNVLVSTNDLLQKDRMEKSIIRTAKLITPKNNYLNKLLNIKTSNVKPSTNENTLFYSELETVKPNISEIISAEPGYIIKSHDDKTGLDLTIEALAPMFESENVNDTSLVLKLTFGDTSFLFMGDAEGLEEYTLLSKDYTDKTTKLKSNVLKVGHHGSNSSSSKDFLRAVAPEIAVISVGLNNDYGHPHQGALASLSEIGARILRTDLDNTITITSDGEKIKVHNS